MAYYTRIGNKTLQGEELSRLTDVERKKIEDEAEQRRLKLESEKREKLEKALGLAKAQNTTFDVRPEAIAARKAEAEKILAEESIEIKTDQTVEEAIVIEEEIAQPDRSKKSKKNKSEE